VGGKEEGRVGPCVLHLAHGRMPALIMPQTRVPVYGVFPYLLPKKHPISSGKTPTIADAPLSTADLSLRSPRHALLPKPTAPLPGVACQMHL
jgi:hypothetical protein